MYNPNSQKLLDFLERIKMSKILDQMKQDLITATKAKNTIEKDILRLVISDRTFRSKYKQTYTFMYICYFTKKIIKF